MDVLKYRIHKEVTPKSLLQTGFTKIGHDTYSFLRPLYKNLITLQIFIDLKENEIEFDVTDKNTGGMYAPFWNNINGEHNHVAVRVINKFEEYISEFKKRKIIYEEKNRYEK